MAKSTCSPGVPPAPRSRSGVRAGGALLGLFVAFLTAAFPVGGGTACAAETGADSLEASSDVPWNPPHALARRTGWEQAVLLPGRIASLPLSGLGRVSETLTALFERNPRFSGGPSSTRRSADRTVIVGTPRLGDRTGLGGSVEVRTPLLRGALATTLSAEYSGTIRDYNRTLLRWSGRPLSLQYGYEWRPQDRFYGIGNATSVDSATGFATQSEFVRGELAWGSGLAAEARGPRTTLRVWGGPSSRVTRTGREIGELSYEARFPVIGAATLDRRVESLVYGVSILHDHRNGSPHWSGGWRTLLSAERFDAPVGALALHSGSGDGARFTRYQAQAEAGFSFMRDPRTVRVLVRLADQQVDTNRDRMLPSDQSTLGGKAGLGGYASGRFHDLDLLLARLAYVFPLERHFEMDLHSEWGAVYPDLWQDARLNTLRHSMGFALRIRDEFAPRASVGLDFSREAARLRFSLGGVE